MKNIIIKRLRIVNFKGIRNLDITFNGLETRISGANGTGKTTIFDAFTWLLFGKDSKGRTKFNLKTLDESGEPVPHLPHEVTAVLQVDDEVIHLKRCWTEVWTIYRGGREPSFDHNEGERYYNNVPCTEKEFKAKIDAICDESRFRELTNPFYFTSQSREYQRKALLSMVGDLSVEDVIDTDSSKFASLLDFLSGKTIEEFGKEVAFHKKHIKDTIADLEPRLDEKMRDLSGLSVENWSQLESQINKLREDISDIDSQIADIGKAYSAAAEERSDKGREIARLQGLLDKRQLQLKDELLADYRQQLSEYYNNIRSIDDFNANAEHTKRNLESQTRIKENLRQEYVEQKEMQERKRSELLKEYYALMDSKFDEDSAVCPTCHRPFEATERNLLEQEFMDERNAAIERNKQQGKRAKELIATAEQVIAQCDKEISELQSAIGNIEYKSKDSVFKPTQPDIDTQLSDDSESVHLDNQITALRKEMSQDVAPADTSELRSRKRAIEAEISELTKRLSVRSEMERTERRVAELENALKTNRIALEEDNRMESLIFDFNKAKMDLLEARINGLFSYVRFRMYYRQNNGELAETCECMIDGVPYSDLNSAAQINAGLDIINAISRVHGMCAPIFIDNRESVTNIISTEAQVISLVVDSDYKSLFIQ